MRERKDCAQICKKDDAVGYAGKYCGCTALVFDRNTSRSWSALCSKMVVVR